MKQNILLGLTLFSVTNNSSTYKPVFLKSLLFVSDCNASNRLIGHQWFENNGGTIQVDLNTFAI
jgi:hypothetical protein